jgi:hypothetical protein
MVLWTHLAQETWLGSLTAAPVLDPASIATEGGQSGLKSHRSRTIVILERLRDAVGIAKCEMSADYCSAKKERRWAEEFKLKLVTQQSSVPFAADRNLDRRSTNW